MKQFVLGLFIVLLSSCYALGQESYEWGRGSYILLQEADSPGAIAEVVFHNTAVHPLAVDTKVLVLDGLEVEVTVETNTTGTDDTITVLPPEGFYAYPPQVEVPEMESTVILIMEGGLS